MNLRFLTFDSIDSTNSEALRQAKLGAEEGLCVLSRHQTAGRGRQGRVWVSESDAGLYLSILLRPKFDAKHLPLITLMAGVAVCEALRDFRLAPDIKWVNDVLINEKKICGILAETAETPSGLAVVVGIGINIRSSNFPPEIAETATSMEASANTGNGSAAAPSPEQLAQVVANYLDHFYQVLSRRDGPNAIISEWRERSTYYSGKEVRVALGEHSIQGVTDGLEENGALRVRLANGDVSVVQAGDVQRLRAAESTAGIELCR